VRRVGDNVNPPFSAIYSSRYAADNSARADASHSSNKTRSRNREHAVISARRMFHASAHISSFLLHPFATFWPRAVF
jgi:hypothetical protein